MIKRNPNTDRYGDGDIPEADYEPYQDNQFEPHPQTSGDNKMSKDKRPTAKSDGNISHSFMNQ